jgi:hypothetical protein
MKFSIFAVVLIFFGITLAGECPAPEVNDSTLVALFRENFSTVEPKPEFHIYTEDLDVCKGAPVGVECMDISKGYACSFYE